MDVLLSSNEKEGLHAIQPLFGDLLLLKRRRLLVEEKEIQDRSDQNLVLVSIIVPTISILCNIILLFLISRKRTGNEESNQPIYHRIMCAMAITTGFIVGNYLVAAFDGSMADILMNQHLVNDVASKLTDDNNISFRCYMQSFVDFFFYRIYMLESLWLMLYFLLRLNYGMVNIPPYAEAFTHLSILMFSFGNCIFGEINGSVAPYPPFGICVVETDIDYNLSAIITVGLFFAAMIAMLFIIYRTFRDEQQIQQHRFEASPQIIQKAQSSKERSQKSFEATKDITMQALALVLFLFSAFGLNFFVFILNGIPIMSVMFFLSQGVYLLGLYLWFEIRNIKKHYPNISTKTAIRTIFMRGGHVEASSDSQLQVEETPLMPDRKRCLIDMTVVEDELCNNLIHDLDEIDRQAKLKEEAEARRRHEEEAKRQKLEEENMRMFGGGYANISDMTDFQGIIGAHFGNLDKELAIRRHNHYNNKSRKSNVPIQDRYGSIDPSTFRRDVPAEEAVENASANNEPMQEVRDERTLCEIKEEEEDADNAEQDHTETTTDNQLQANRGNVATRGRRQQSGDNSLISDLTSITTLRF